MSVLHHSWRCRLFKVSRKHGDTKTRFEEGDHCLHARIMDYILAFARFEKNLDVSDVSDEKRMVRCMPLKGI